MWFSATTTSVSIQSPLDLLTINLLHFDANDGSHMIEYLSTAIANASCTAFSWFDLTEKAQIRIDA
jgi:hypothetical protein